MKTADVTQSVLILVVFFLLFFSTILMVGVAEVNENWATYRCNPMVIPFASLFGHDPVENFNHCAGSIQSIQMSSILQPLSQQVEQVETDTAQNRAAARRAGHRQQGLMTVLSTLSDTLGEMSTNLAVETNRSSIAVTNIFRKMAGILQVVTSTVRGVTLTGKSIKNVAERVA